MGDALVGGILRLALRRRDGFDGVIASFCHSDPVATYVGPRLRRVAERVFSHVQSQYDATVVASRAIQDRLEALGVANVVRAPFGVDPLFLGIARYPPDRSRPTALLYAGRLDADKEIGLLIDIVPRLLMRRDVTLTVVGAGRDEAFFRRLSHPRFTYRGFIRDRAELARVYSASDVLLAPGRFETFGLAALEAAASGLVVVGPNAGGTGELLAQMDSPLLFEAGDAAAFYDAIDRAVGSDLGCLAARSRALAAIYGTWDDAVARHVALYESMVERR